MPENIHTKFQDNRTKFRDFGILGGEDPSLGGDGGEFRNAGKGIRLKNVVQSIHTKFQGNLTIFRDGRF